MVDFVVKCITCEQVRVECKHPIGLLQPIPIMEWKSEVISMDFIIGLLRTSRKHDAIMVVIDNLSKVAHILVVRSTNLVSEVAHIFIKEIVRLHGFPKKIISDRDAKFTSKFWKDLFVGLGNEFTFNTTYHPKRNGQTKRKNRIVEDMLMMYVMHQPKKWE